MAKTKTTKPHEANGKRRGPGRPRIEFDLELVEAMGKIGATAEEMAHVLPAGLRTIKDRMADEDSEFRTAYNKGYSSLKMSLRRKQVDMAMKGDRTMLIWLGKQILGQRDRLQHDSSVKVELGETGDLDRMDVARAREFLEATRQAN